MTARTRRCASAATRADPRAPPPPPGARVGSAQSGGTDVRVADAAAVKAAFESMDADGDGRIDMDDWSCFFRRHGQWQVKRGSPYVSPTYEFALLAGTRALTLGGGLQEGWMDKAVTQLLHDMHSVGISIAHLFRSAEAEAGAEQIRVALCAREWPGGGSNGQGHSRGGSDGQGHSRGGSDGQVLDESWSRSTENASYLCDYDPSAERAPRLPPPRPPARAPARLPPAPRGWHAPITRAISVSVELGRAGSRRRRCRAWWARPCRASYARLIVGFASRTALGMRRMRRQHSRSRTATSTRRSRG
jgi:hypothetical protein